MKSSMQSGAVLLSLLCLMARPPEVRAQQPGALLAAARRQIDALYPDSAVVLLRSVLAPRSGARTKQRVQTLVLLGITDLMHNQPDTARRVFEEALTLSPDLTVDTLAELHSRLIEAFASARASMRTRHTSEMKATLGATRGVVVQASTGLKFKTVSVGEWYACGVVTTGDVYCWGARDRANPADSMQDSIIPKPYLVAGGRRFVSVETSDDNTCALDTAGVAVCWGDNDAGQLGFEPRDPRDVMTPPTPVPSAVRFAALSVGPKWACGLGRAGMEWRGHIYCWGRYAFRSLVDAAAPLVTKPEMLPSNQLWKSLARSDGWFLCAVSALDEGHCWGAGMGLEPDARAESVRNGPVPVGYRFRMISGGIFFACGVTTEHSILCWGRNVTDMGEPGDARYDPSAGMLGAGESGAERAFSPVPVRVVGSQRWNAVATGDKHVCAITERGEAFCWGQNKGSGQPDQAAGRLGTGDSLSSANPRRVAGGLRFRSVSAGLDSTCGVTVDGDAYCWGGNTFGQLGNGKSGRGSYSLTPVRVELTPS
jgi:alpha-tubulin suppressor-like RCC1 family protein